MNDTPDWAAPGSAPSDREGSGPGRPADPRVGGSTAQEAPGAHGPGEPSDTAPGAPPAAPSAEGHRAAAGEADAPPAAPVPGPQQPADVPGAPADPGAAKWSARQPPPGQWSAPGPSGPPSGNQPPSGWGNPGGQGSGPGWGAGGSGWGAGGSGGPGGPGWGGQSGGWGRPGWNAGPPAAKPGVIPLRPLGVGEILDGAVSTMRTYWRTVLGVALTVAVVTQIGVVLLQGFVLKDAAGADALSDPNASVDELMDAMGGALLSSGVVIVITLLGTIVATALLTSVTSRAVLGRPVTAAEAWHEARPQLPRLLGLTLLLPLMAAGIVVAGMVPGIVMTVAASSDAGIALMVLGGLAGLGVAIWLMVRFSLASPALMLERQTIRKAMSRSVKLVTGSWWRVLGIQLLASVIANIVSSIILIPFTLIAGAFGDGGFNTLLNGGGQFGWTYLIVSGVGSVIGSMLTFPISAGVIVLLYIDQRIRREALDLELARAAGVVAHGSTPGAAPGH